MDPIYLPWPMVMDMADALDQAGYTTLAQESRMAVWDEAERQWNKPKWNGWDCTNCGLYHGYGSTFHYDADVLCSDCNYAFGEWLEALGRLDEWKG